MAALKCARCAKRKFCLSIKSSEGRSLFCLVVCQVKSNFHSKICTKICLDFRFLAVFRYAKNCFHVVKKITRAGSAFVNNLRIFFHLVSDNLIKQKIKNPVPKIQSLI